MATAYKCDLCGELYERYSTVRLDEAGIPCTEIRVGNDSISRRFDLCPNCMEAVINLLNSRKEKN